MEQQQQQQQLDHHPGGTVSNVSKKRRLVEQQLSEQQQIDNSDPLNVLRKKSEESLKGGQPAKATNVFKQEHRVSR